MGAVVRESDPRRYARANRTAYVRRLEELVRIPSVSAQPRHAGDVRRCAARLAGYLRRSGLEGVRVLRTPRHPLVYGEWRRAPGRPTVLIYGHYDVQPADPVSEWRSPPFEPTRRGADLFGRGASDDKGQLLAHVHAIEAFLKTRGRLPVNVRCLFEGEEEIGSPHLPAFLRRNRVKLRSDVAVVSDTRILAADRPAITYALRGGLGLELEVCGPGHDLHSGTFGGAVHNPLQALCEIVARLHDDRNRVAVPGFYDRVRDADAAERAALRRDGPSDGEILRDARAARGWGEEGYSLFERTTLRPALTVNGLTGGYQGPGGKSIVPARASAKLSFRLVPDQDPREVERLVREQIGRLSPPGVRTRVRTLSRSNPAVVDRDHPALKAAAAAYRHGFGASPVFLRSGGSIPIVNHFWEVLGVPTVLMGFALPDDRMHAPNEKFNLPVAFRAVDTCIRFLTEAAALAPRRPEEPAGASR